MARKKAPSELRLCPALGFSQIVGGKYKIRILWVLIQRPHRYGEIHTLAPEGHSREGRNTQGVESRAQGAAAARTHSP